MLEAERTDWPRAMAQRPASTGLARDAVGRIRSLRAAGHRRETHLRKIAALALLVVHGGITAGPLPIEGSYVARTLNGRAIPAELRLPVEDGDFRLFRLEQGVLHLGGGGRFTLYFRYYHQLVRRGTRPVVTPVLSESEVGTYTVKAGRLMLVPTKKKGARSRPTIAATISGEEIRASYLLQNGSGSERVALVLRRDASYW